VWLCVGVAEIEAVELAEMLGLAVTLTETDCVKLFDGVGDADSEIVGDEVIDKLTE